MHAVEVLKAEVESSGVNMQRIYIRHYLSDECLDDTEMKKFSPEVTY